MRNHKYTLYLKVKYKVYVSGILTFSTKIVYDYRMNTGTDILLLSKNELEILKILKKHKQATPVFLAQHTAIPRATVYITLDKLKERGFIRLRKIEHKKIWELAPTETVLERIESIKDLFIENTAEYQTLNISENTDIAIYRGEKEIIKLFKGFAENHGGKRLLGVMGDRAGESWSHSISLRNINTVNEKIKEKGLLTETITSIACFEQQIKMFGQSWVDGYSGRASEVHILDSKYLDYEGQVFVFGNKVYLVHMRDKLFIEIKNAEISKMIICMLKFIQDNSKSVNLNELLKELSLRV